MDLADFPWVRFGRPQRALQTLSRLEPYTFTDVINSPNGPLERFWAVHPHPEYGFPSESTQRLFLVLLDLWAAEGFRSAHIVFHSLTHLYHRLGGRGNCPQNRALRIHRDLQILDTPHDSRQKRVLGSDRPPLCGYRPFQTLQRGRLHAAQDRPP